MNDLISRQAAIDAINGVLVEDDACKVWFRLALQNLPSAQLKSYRSYREGYQTGFNEGYQAGFKDAQSERKRGKWKSYRCDMYKCSECGYIYTELTELHRCGAKYCPNCGAKMEE